MIRADLVVTGIAELASPEGTSARVADDLARVRVIRDAAVAAFEGRFVFVGTERELREAVELVPGGRSLDARGGTALPGFVDAHTHLPFAGWREGEFDERMRGATYSEIAARGGGILSTVAATRAVDRATLAALVRARLDAMLASGTTLAEAKSGYGLTFVDELKQLEALREGAAGHPVVIAPTFLGAHTVPKEHRDSRERYVEMLVAELIPEVARRGLAEYADAFVDAHAFAPAEARRVLEAAAARGLRPRLHADQLADDGSAELAAAIGAVSADHLEYASDRGLEAMARAGVCGVLLPTAAYFLMQQRRPPARRLVAAGVPVVVATDFNPGTSPCESMGTALEQACLIAGLTVDEAITATTLNAAHALGRGASHGSIEVGKRADLVVHGVPNRYHLVYRFGVRRVRTVVAAGQVVSGEDRLGS